MYICIFIFLYVHICHRYLESRVTLSRGEKMSVGQLWECLRSLLYEQTEPPDTEGGGGGGAAGGGSADMQRGCFSVEHLAEYSEVRLWPPYEERPWCVQVRDARKHLLVSASLLL